MGCIYRLWNTVNSMAYIGQTKHDTPEDRINNHLSGTYKYQGKVHTNSQNQNPLIKADVERYGKEAFDWEIVCSDIKPEDLDEYETLAIMTYDTLYPSSYNKSAGPPKWRYKYNATLLPYFVKTSTQWKYKAKEKLWEVYDPMTDDVYIIKRKGD